MKYLLISILISFSTAKTFAQIQNPQIKHADIPECEIMQIGLTDSATHVFFKYSVPPKYSNGGWICVGENFYIKDNQTGIKYKMLNSLNIPICPTKEVFSNTNQIHYFSLSFQPIPKETQEIDIIESPENGFNFFGVSLKENQQVDNSINYVKLLEETPVKEGGKFLKDGKTVQYFVHNGLVLTMHLAIENVYGKYYTAYVSIENHSGKRIEFYPEKISAKTHDGQIESPLQVFSYEAYMKKVKRKQNWNSFWVALGEASIANSAGYSVTQTQSNTKSYIRSNSYSTGYFGNEYGSVSTNIRTYGNFSTTTTTYNYDATANYYAQQNARNNLERFDNMQYEIKESINQGYLKSNTIFPDQRINGFINIEFKKTDYTFVSIEINKEYYNFIWSNPK